ncbi:MAG: hypothetical protein K0Q77_1494 [Anaerosporomusa subterranea]|jgi:hypothetical protein|nr:hypothetical protein [Anaerosporomusa subterranea]
MSAVFGYMMSRDVKSPVRASDLSSNWIGMSFFKQTTYRKPLSESLGCK